MASKSSARAFTSNAGRVNIKDVLGDADRAFERLLAWGCGRHLAGLLVLLHTSSVPCRRGSRELYFRRADSDELMLNSLSRKEARARITQAKRALERFENALTPLRGARIWRRTGDTLVGPFGSRLNRQLQSLKRSLERASEALENALHEVGPKVHPVASGKIERIVRYVRDKTGQYHDSEVAEVLAAAIGEPVPPGYPRFADADSLKSWRTDRRIVDRSGSKPEVYKS